MIKFQNLILFFRITKKAKVIITIIKEATNQVIQITKAETINFKNKMTIIIISFKNLIIRMIKIKDIMIKEIVVNKKIIVIKIKQMLLMNSKKAK